MSFLSQAPLLEKSRTYSLRGLAMLMIIIQHIHSHIADTPRILFFVKGWGYVGTGLFFFLSGYGLFLSLNRRDFIPFKWLQEKLVKMILPFLFAFSIYELIDIFLFHSTPSLDIVASIFSLTIPNTTTWFLKVIVILYIFVFAIFRLKIQAKTKLYITTCICIIYFLLSFVYLPDFWYSSILNFPLGMYFGLRQNKNKQIRLQNLIWLLALGLALYLLIPVNYSFFTSIIITLASIYLITFININNKLFCYIGSHSINFYIFQLIWLQIGRCICPTNNYLYICFVFLATFLSSILYSDILKFDHIFEKK